LESFDSTPQFKAILQDSFPISKNGFSCFIDRKGKVISTNHPTIQPMEHIELDEKILHHNTKDPAHHFINHDGNKYLLGVAQSEGYREYKRHDNYKNDLLSIILIEY